MGENDSGSPSGDSSVSGDIKIDLSLDINKTWEQIYAALTFEQEYNITIINRTANKLTRIGAYNLKSVWPLNEIDKKSAITTGFRGSVPTGEVEIAASYKIENTEWSFQFAVNWPMIGNRKIGIHKSTRLNKGNDDAKFTFLNKLTTDDTGLETPDYRVRAFMAQKENGNVSMWVFEVIPR